MILPSGVTGKAVAGKAVATEEINLEKSSFSVKISI